MNRKVSLECLSTRASLAKFIHACYGLSLPRKLWVMGYKGFMGYVGDFPASQLGRWDFLWVMGGYGLREVWVIRVSTVQCSTLAIPVYEPVHQDGDGREPFDRLAPVPRHSNRTVPRVLRRLFVSSRSICFVRQSSAPCWGPPQIQGARASALS